MKFFRFLILVLVSGLVGVQFKPASLNQNTVVLSTDFTKTFKVPENVQILLKKSCYDCHSNNTNYPWYNKVQPLSWVLENHIKEGKEELNFSEFGVYSKRRQKSKLKSILNQIKDDEMPLSSYTLIHRESRLTISDKKEVITWINKMIDNY
jgi:hypothetical protein